MLLLSSVKKFLLLFQYPRFSSSLDGDYDVATLKTRMSPDLEGCQIHYPTTTKSKNVRVDRKKKKGFLDEMYFRKEAVQGLANYTRTSEEVLDFLSTRKYPFPFGEDVYHSSSSSSTFPVILFSHGLGGCMEMYSQLCSSLASYGYLVFSLEHEDGSGCYAETVEGYPVYYKLPDDTPYSREKVLQFRGPMLKQRTREVEKFMKYLLDEISQAKNRENETKNESVNAVLLGKILSAAKMEDGFSLVGHSFGAATMTLVSQRNSYPINSIASLDPWCFSLPDSVLSRGVHTPLLVILSESWTKNKELPQVLKLLENSPSSPSCCWWLPGTVHQSFADSANWLPSIVARRMYMRGANEPRHVTISVTASMCVSHIQRKNALPIQEGSSQKNNKPLRFKRNTSRISLYNYNLKQINT